MEYNAKSAGAVWCTFCNHGDSLRLYYGTSITQVACDCGVSGPNVAPGDFGKNTDQQRIKKAVELWNKMNLLIELGIDSEKNILSE